MRLSKTALSENISLTAIKTDKFKSGGLSLSLTLPCSRGARIIATVLCGVLGRGTQRFPDIGSINRHLDDLYSAEIGIRSSRLNENLTITLSADFLDNSFAADGTDILGGVLEMMAEMLYSPRLVNGHFPEETVAQEAGFVCDSLRSEINNTRAYSYDRCLELMHRDDKNFLTLEQCIEIAETVTKEDIMSLYLQALSQSSLVFFYIGHAEPYYVQKAIMKHFSHHAPKSSYTPLLPLPEAPCEFIEGSESMPVTQGKLTMGMRTSHGIAKGDHHAGILLNEIFGGSPASKLFLNVRERLNLCYHCSSSFDINSGCIMVSTGLDVRNRHIAESEILRQFDDIRKGKITDGEMLAAKRSLENIYRQIYDSPAAIQGFYRAREFFGFDETPESCLETILSLSVDDVSALARETVVDTVFFLEGTLTSDDGEA